MKYPPVEFEEGVKMVSLSRQICAKKWDGKMQCWNPITNEYKRIVSKYSVKIKLVETSDYKTCVIT